LLHDMWDLSSLTRDPARGEALIPTRQGRFLTTGPPGESPSLFSYAHWLFPFLCELPVLILCPFSYRVIFVCLLDGEQVFTYSGYNLFICLKHFLPQ